MQVVVLSPLNNFMVSSLHHNREERPSSLQWGLMGSVQVMTSLVTSCDLTVTSCDLTVTSQ